MSKKPFEFAQESVDVLNKSRGRKKKAEIKIKRGDLLLTDTENKIFMNAFNGSMFSDISIAAYIRNLVMESIKKSGN